MTKIPMLPSILASATLAFAGAGLASAAHAHDSPLPAQNASPQTAPSQNKTRRPWTSSKTSTHSWATSQSTATAKGAPMGMKADSKTQECSDKALAKGLWGKARKRFMQKCLNRDPSSTNRSMGAAMGTPMGMKANSKTQECSDKALAKGLWGKARKRFMQKCLKMS